MTLEELTQFIIQADREGLCRALAPLNEKQRAFLAGDAVKLFDRVDNGWSASAFGKKEKMALLDDPETAKLVAAMSKVKYADWRLPRLTAALAVLGLCGKQELETYRGNWFQGDLHDMPHRVLQVLSDRRPPWLAAWMGREARPGKEPNSSGIVTWTVERGLIRAGALAPSDTESYILSMAQSLPWFIGHGTAFEITSDCLPSVCGSLREYLLADPDLLQHEVWRLFEVETPALSYELSPWFEVFHELSASGHVDRRELLEASARGMTLPFRQGALSGYAKFHESLQPTLDERAELTAAYLAQLASDLPLVAGQALDALEILAKAKRLHVIEFLTACPLVFRLEKKAPASKALKLIKLLVKQDASCSGQAAQAASAGLGHPSPDIQEQALDLLEALADKLPAALRGELASVADHIAAALRPRLEKLTGSQAPEKPAAKAAREKSDAGPQAALQARAAALPPAPLQEASGVTAALAAIAEQRDPWPGAIDPRSVPRRDPALAVAPIASLDELIDVVSAFVERVDDAMEVERILDGILRFHSHRPDDFEKRTAALRKRILARSEPFSGSVLDVARQVGIAQVIRAWLALPELPAESGSWRDVWTRFFCDRCEEIGYRLQPGQSENQKERELPLLALPTHQGGWLDPVVLVERMQTYQGAKRGDWGFFAIRALDLAQALLRLTPDGRGEALAACEKLVKHRYVTTLQFALGGSGQPESLGGLHGDMLVMAAAHARAVIDPDGPSGLDCVLPRVSLRDDGGVEAVGPIADDLAMPSDLLIRAHSWSTFVPRQDSWGTPAGNQDWLTDWRSQVWPFDRRPICLWALLSRQTSPAALKNLLDPGVSWGDEAARLAAWALGSESPAAKVLITDALIEGFRDCRIDPRLLGRHLAAIAADLKLNRAADVLAEAARVSPLHHWSVLRTLDSALAHLPSPPRDLHHWLTPLLESATTVGQALSDEARTLLETIKGSSKTAKLAAQLLGLKIDPAKMAAIRELALGACVDRAERWQSLSAGR